MEQFLYSWKSDFYRHLKSIHHIINSNPETLSKWETVWKPLIRTFIDPLKNCDIHYLNMFSIDDSWTDPSITSISSLEDDSVYFGLDFNYNIYNSKDISIIEKMLNTFTVPVSCDILDLHALTLLLVPLRLYGIEIQTSLILNDLYPNLEYWKSFQNSVFKRVMHYISYTPSLLIMHLNMTKRITYDPNQRFTRLCEHNHVLNTILGKWIHSFSKQILESPKYESIAGMLKTIYEIINQAQIDDDNSIEYLFIKCTRSLANFRSRNLTLITSLSQPSWIVRSWFPITLTCLGIYNIAKLCDLNWILTSVYEAKITFVSFIKYWIKDPILAIWHTIRYENSEINGSKSFCISQADSLRSDLDSLERMIIQFSKEHPELSGSTSRIDSADMNIVLKQYEHELISPIKNVIMGDLVRLILIQVQKSKVDLQLALHAVDKLLKSNELNFAFLAVFPTLLIVYLVLFKIKSWHRSWIGASRYQLIDNIERHLHHMNIDSKDDYDLGSLVLVSTCLYRDALLLLLNEFNDIEIDSLHSMAQWNGSDLCLSLEQRYIIWILSDLPILINNRDPIVLERMNRSLDCIKNM